MKTVLIIFSMIVFTSNLLKCNVDLQLYLTSGACNYHKNGNELGPNKEPVTVISSDYFKNKTVKEVIDSISMTHKLSGIMIDINEADNYDQICGCLLTFDYSDEENLNLLICIDSLNYVRIDKNLVGKRHLTLNDPIMKFFEQFKYQKITYMVKFLSIRIPPAIIIPDKKKSGELKRQKK